MIASNPCLQFIIVMPHGTAVKVGRTPPPHSLLPIVSVFMVHHLLRIGSCKNPCGYSMLLYSPWIEWHHVQFVLRPQRPLVPARQGAVDSVGTLPGDTSAPQSLPHLLLPKTGHAVSMINADQYRSMADQNSVIDPKCWSIKVNADQLRSMLIFIDRHWYLLTGIGVNATNLIRHWSELIGIDHWYSMSC